MLYAESFCRLACETMSVALRQRSGSKVKLNLL